MDKDFYLDRRWLASYFEKDWFDKVIETQALDDSTFEYPRFNPQFLYSDYHEQLVRHIHEATKNSSASTPKTLLEVGSSLGRTYYEICKKIPSINRATLVEPSQNLASGFDRIFLQKSPQNFEFLVGNQRLAEIQFDSASVQETCRSVHCNLINQPYEALSSDVGQHDLVICSNVLDQCKRPGQLVEFLKERTALEGSLVLSCTYQWNNQYILEPSEAVSDIKSYFHEGWNILGETNVEFKCRRFERHWLTFLSHVVVFEKQGNN